MATSDKIKSLRQERSRLINEQSPQYARDYLKEQYKRYSINKVRKLSNLPLERQEEILQRDIDILTGSYQEKRAQQYVDNYASALLKQNVDIGLVNDFRNTINKDNLDIFLPYLQEINILYNEQSNSIEDKLEFILNTIEEYGEI